MFTHSIAEPSTTALFLLVFGSLILFSVVLWRNMTRLGIPVVLLFLGLGILGGSEGLGRIEFSDYEFAFRLGTIALVLILFDGGFNTSLTTVRQSFAPAGALATIGVVLTAALVAVFANAFGLGWGESFLIGAIVSSTDAAAVFSVLRGSGIRLKERVRGTLELESCVNDPMAVILTMAVIQILAYPATHWWEVLIFVPIQLVVGILVGGIIGAVGRYFLEHLKLSMGGLYPVYTLSIAAVSFGLTTLVEGSGFLAVFVSGFVLGNGHIPYRQGLARVHDAIAWLCQISLFLMLGLLVFPSQLMEVGKIGLLIAIALTFIARPLAAWVCLLPFRFTWRESAFISWVGLRGAVPIVLATFPVFAKVPEAEQIFHIVFFIVVLSSIIPGTTILGLSKRWRLLERPRPQPSTALEVNSIARLHGEIRHYLIDPSVYACNLTLAEISLPAGAGIILISRGDQMVAARGATKILAGDHVYVFCDTESRAAIEELFSPQGDHLSA